MLMVHTQLQPSLVAGTGLFAAEKIEKDQVIWQLDDRTTKAYPAADWEQMMQELPETARGGFERFAYLRKGSWYLNLDDSRFFNHDPAGGNVYYCEQTDQCLARRLIAAGEELTCDYTEFDESGLI